MMPDVPVSEKPAGSNVRAATIGTTIAAAVTTILVWVLGQFGIAVPAEVAVAISTVIGGVVGYRTG